MTSPHPDGPQDEVGATVDSPGGAGSAGGVGDAGRASGDAEEGVASAYDPLRKVAARDEARLALVILRDVAVVSAFLSLFAAAESWATISRLVLAKILSVV